MTLLGLEKLSICIEKRRNFYNRQKNGQITFSSKVMSTTLLSKQLFTIDLQHSTRLSPLGSSEQLNSETCRMLELLESDMTKEAKARSGGGYSLSFDAPTPRFAPPRRRLVACAAQSKKRE